MREYEKPTALINEGVSEGVFAASGAVGRDCYHVTTNIHQKPETGRGDYRIQVDADHSATHHSTEQTLVISFNLPVEYQHSNGELVSGNGTDTLRIRFGYHNNGYDRIGMGDVIVTAEAGLGVTNAIVECNMKCDQHDS